jgi:flagellar basal-body rod protein FlgB
MRTSLDNYLGIHPQALALESQRNDLLAANLANVDTPNFKARDLDFKAALSAAGAGSFSTTPGTAGGSIGATSATTLELSGVNGTAGPLAGAGSADAGLANGGTYSAALKYRVPMAPSLDGNTVDEQLEQSAFAENTVRYQTTLAILSTKLKDLMTAITGS